MARASSSSSHATTLRCASHDATSTLMGSGSANLYLAEGFPSAALPNEELTLADLRQGSG